MVSWNVLTGCNLTIIMVNFPCPIIKANSCLFLASPYQQYPVSPPDGSPEHSFRLVALKGSFRDSCWFPHCLRDEMLLPLPPGNHRWEGFGHSLSQSTEDSASLSCMLVLPNGKVLSSQPLSADCTQGVEILLTHTYSKWWGKELFAKGKMSCYFLFSQPEIISKGACF